MADNILKGIILLEAKGVAQTTSQVASAVSKTEQSLKRLSPASNQATQSLTNLSRVAQDAPYGFIGIANNINPLLESFQRLKATTGTTGGALKALGQSLTGAAGIGLAIGVVSSLLVVFGDKLFGASKAAKEAEDANKKLAESITGDLVQLTTLVGVIQNVNTSTENRAKALQAVNEQYAKYIPSLEKEGITAANLAKSYDLITEALIRQAVVKGIQKEIEELVTKTAGSIIKLQKAEEEKRIATEKANTAHKAEVPALDAAAKKMQQYQGTIKDGNIAQVSQRVELTKSIGSINNYETAIASLTKKLKDQLAPLLNLTTNFQDLDLTLKSTKTVPEIKIAPKKITIAKVADFDFDAAAIGTIKIPKPKVKFDQTGGGLAGTEVGDLSAYEKALAAAGEKLSNAFTDALHTGITGGIEALGEGIGNALSGKSFGSTIINVIGSMLSQIGKALIQYGIIKEGLDKILGPGGLVIPGAVAIGLGVAAIAAGQAFKNFGGFRAGGGGVKSGKGYIVGEKGPEWFMPGADGTIIPNGAISSIGSTGGGLGGRVVFEIAGNKLRGVLSAANRSGGRLE